MLACRARPQNTLNEQTQYGLLSPAKTEKAKQAGQWKRTQLGDWGPVPLQLIKLFHLNFNGLIKTQFPLTLANIGTERKQSFSTRTLQWEWVGTCGRAPCHPAFFPLLQHSTYPRHGSTLGAPHSSYGWCLTDWSQPTLAPVPSSLAPLPSFPPHAPPPPPQSHCIPSSRFLLGTASNALWWTLCVFYCLLAWCQSYPLQGKSHEGRHLICLVHYISWAQHGAECIAGT